MIINFDEERSEITRYVADYFISLLFTTSVKLYSTADYIFSGNGFKKGGFIAEALANIKKDLQKYRRTLCSRPTTRSKLGYVFCQTSMLSNLFMFIYCIFISTRKLGQMIVDLELRFYFIGIEFDLKG